jgi:hypothetical protein
LDKILFPLPIFFLLFISCIFQRPAISQSNEGPYIDSLGYRAAQARLDDIGRASGDAMISQALQVPKTALEQENQSEFFRSIEESYQRYLKLFIRISKKPRPEIRCAFDLIETFNRQVYDPQPFVNAILHTMALTDLSTLDFTVQPHTEDTVLVHVSWARAETRKGTKEYAISEGNLTLAVTRHTAALATSMP